MSSTPACPTPPMPAEALLAAIGQVQRQFIEEANLPRAFDGLLSVLLRVTGSEYGFIGEVWQEPGRTAPALRMLAISDIAWDEASRQMMALHRQGRLVFRSLDSLFGRVIQSGQPVLSNDPRHDPRSGGLPPGHRVMDNFLGLPFFRGDELLGMVGVANRPGGYDPSLIQALQPLLTTCAALTTAARAEAGRRQAEAALRLSEARWQFALESAGDGVWDWDLDADRLAYSPLGLAALGYAEGQVGPRMSDWVALVHPDDRAACHQAIVAHLQGRTPMMRSQHRLRAADGRYRWVLMRGKVIDRHPDGRARRAVGVVTDMSATLAQQAAAEEAMATLRKLARQAPGVLYQFRFHPDARMSFPYASENFESLFGVPLAEVQDDVMRLIARVHDADRAGLLASIFEASRNVTPWMHEFRFVRPDGAVRWIMGHSSPEREDDGCVLFHGFLTDITERKHLQDELARMEEMRRARAAAEAANRAKTVFLSHMSHELRTPLNAVLGFAQLLRDDPSLSLPPSRRQWVEHIHAAGQHLLGMITDLLDLTRIEAGALLVRQDTIPLDEVLEECLSMLRPQADAAQIGLHAPAPSGLSVQGDRQRLRQILLNLVGNAIKYSPSGSEVWVHTGHQGERVAISVRDSGPGIPPERRDELFTPFNRLGREHGRIDGAGVGLALSQGLARLMGGQIHVDSQPGQGSTFTLELRAAPYAQN
ncbi:sensor histidine kinase [Caldimonas taiwanensis]|uniref:sensor histidine kinase n=1 Tax=Caldimonas taiwanensis TaxID=307483 RepID=UPI0012FAB35A|nr:PAS domain-containing protein [Caldimonas taiwanensis]